jgi:hypothetical protein
MQGGLLPDDLAQNARAFDLSFARRFGAWPSNASFLYLSIMNVWIDK